MTAHPYLPAGVAHLSTHSGIQFDRVITRNRSRYWIVQGEIHNKLTDAQAAYDRLYDEYRRCEAKLYFASGLTAEAWEIPLGTLLHWRYAQPGECPADLCQFPDLQSALAFAGGSHG